MAEGDLEIRIQANGEGGLRAVARALREAAAGGLQRALNRNIRDRGAPIIGELRSAVLAVEVESSRGGVARPDYSRALRARVASAVRMSIAFRGIRFGVESSRIGDGRYSTTLVKYLDSELPGYQNWRHPVFGRDVWAVQRGKPWFFETIRRHSLDFQRACEDAMDETIQKIGR